MASDFVNCEKGYITYGLFEQTNSEIEPEHILYGYRTADEQKESGNSVRSAVAIKINVKLEGNSNSGWRLVSV